MNDFLKTEMHDSVSLFNYLFQNKLSSYAFLEDGTKLKGTLIGWDDNFLLLLDGETIQLLSLKRLLRLEATTANILEKATPKVVSPKPKMAPSLKEIKAPEPAEKEDSAEPDKEFKDRLDQLVRNW